MGTLGSRISQLRNKKGMSQEELSKFLKLGKSTLGMYETDKREPSHETTTKIAEFFGVTLDWLLTGRSVPMKDLPEEDARLVKLFNELNEKDQDYILDFMRRMAEMNNKKE